ncbi:MAG: hypothetical protein KDB22_05265, partial [Planctomycetales bacterium]|nr:hypothetical protein [Planctomycetales bacterium]
MTAKLLRQLFLTVCWFLSCCVSHGFAQALSELPRAEYYVARELFGAAHMQDAAEGFETALSRARRIGDQRWIDSVPPLVMLGECYYQQGNIAAALEQYDAALMLVLAHPAWPDQLETVAEQLPNREAVKGINWFQRSQPIQLLGIPEGIQISVDPTQAQVGPQGAVVAPVSLVTRLDVAEVLHTTAIALMRRWQLLGPLARYSPLAEPLERFFAHNPRIAAPWIVASWSVLRGLSELAGTGGAANSIAAVRAGTLVANQYDYFLSPLALHVLALLDSRQGNFHAALQNLQDASLLAAQFEQHLVLSEVTNELAACALASGRVDLLDPLQVFANWAAKRSTIAFSAALVGTTELAFYAGEIARADKLATQATAILARRDVMLPRQFAQLGFVQAGMAYARNRGGLGRSALLESLAAVHGNATTGAAVPEVFQIQMTLDLLASGAITQQVASTTLTQLLAEPGPLQWQLRPLETLATITTASMPAYQRLLELAVVRGADTSELLTLMDRVQRQRFYESLVLGGRLVAWRDAVRRDPQENNATNRQSVERARQAIPSFSEIQAAIADLERQLQLEPLPLDERKLSSNAKKIATELSALYEQHENQLASLCCRRLPLERVVPPAASLDRIQANLHAADVLLGFAASGQTLFGIAISPAETKTWQVPATQNASAELQSLYLEIGLLRTQGRPLPATVLSADAKWHETAQGLCQLLFPEEVRNMLTQSERIILAPFEKLWYVPYELLPDGDGRALQPWI